MSDEPLAYPLTFSRRVFFGDCDPAGVVFTPNYGRYVFDACEQWLRRVLDIDIADQLKNDEIGTPVRAITTELLYPLKPSDDFEVSVWVKDIGRSSFTLRAIGANSRGRRCFVGDMTCVSTLRLKRAVVELPGHYRRAMQDYQDRSGSWEAAPAPHGT
ncbi:MAG: acyl-CoA thioesterase [Bordetella sp.]|nr:acyl-CoA thioesterase [Bordetella sp.]